MGGGKNCNGRLDGLTDKGEECPAVPFHVIFYDDKMGRTMMKLGQLYHLISFSSLNPGWERQSV